MTNTAIDNVIDMIGDTHDQIDALDSKKTKTRTDLNERLRLVRQLAALEKQFRAFGKRGAERKKFRHDRDDAFFIVTVNLEPDRVADARAFLAKHDPALLRRMDEGPRDDDYQNVRFEMMKMIYGNAPDDVKDEMLGRLRDDAPDWFERRFARKDAIPSL